MKVAVQDCEGWYKDGYSSSNDHEGADSGAAQVTTDQ